MTTYSQVKKLVSEFEVNYPRSCRVDLDILSPIDTEEMWQNADRAGVYFLFDKDEHLQYVGKASMSSSIGARIGTRFSGDNSCTDLKFSEVTQLATIPMVDGYEFEAPAIEEYFIKLLTPPLNVTGK
ncbi:GIY-YIG nuclease family protein [Shewanella kaireitica]|uniref:GIY-YIG nuclease family protein n=1 Tax=Shewanella kaireitica TaxID=212021 RepID=UPI0020105176|nr:GIY-YIG nuclease family protein [Shewanella kaireitica]MCL1095858.1 GIY-YIG nuclease family protein [Shewanella kaireitica]